MNSFLCRHVKAQHSQTKSDKYIFTEIFKEKSRKTFRNSRNILCTCAVSPGAWLFLETRITARHQVRPSGPQPATPRWHTKSIDEPHQEHRRATPRTSTSHTKNIDEPHQEHRRATLRTSRSRTKNIEEPHKVATRHHMRTPRDAIQKCHTGI